MCKHRKCASISGRQAVCRIQKYFTIILKLRGEHIFIVRASPIFRHKQVIIHRCLQPKMSFKPLVVVVVSVIIWRAIDNVVDSSSSQMSLYIIIGLTIVKEIQTACEVILAVQMKYVMHLSFYAVISALNPGIVLSTPVHHGCMMGLAYRTCTTWHCAPEKGFFAASCCRFHFRLPELTYAFLAARA
jgi:hypothetical protein